MANTVNWRKAADELPSKNGDYLVIGMLGRKDNETEGNYGDISVLHFFKRGTLVMYTTVEHDDGLTGEERLLRAVLYPDYWTAEGGFYELDLDERKSYRHLNDNEILYWAELPEIPDTLVGNQNDYLDEEETVDA